MLEIAAQGVAACSRDDRRWLSGYLGLVVIVVRAGVSVVFPGLLLSLLTPIDVVLELDSYLALGRLLLDEIVLQQLFSVRPLMIIFHCKQVNKN